MAVTTYTIREASEFCGVSMALMRRRADRGQLRTVLKDGVRHIPHSELERAGLVPDAEKHVLEREVLHLRAEITELRLLPERIEREWRGKLEAEQRARELIQQDAHRAEQAAQAAQVQARTAIERAEQAELRAQHQRDVLVQVARGSWLSRRRARRTAESLLGSTASAENAQPAGVE